LPFLLFLKVRSCGFLSKKEERFAFVYVQPCKGSLSLRLVTARQQLEMQYSSVKANELSLSLNAGLEARESVGGIHSSSWPM